MSGAARAEPNGAAVGYIGKADVKAMFALFIEIRLVIKDFAWEMSRKCLQIH